MNVDDGPRLIKRYANRKLYDTVIRRFTTLDEVAALVKDGTSIRVVDHENGVDRTEQVLAQVLGRQVDAGRGSERADLLTELLRAPASAALGIADAIAGRDARKEKSPVVEPEPEPVDDSAGKSDSRDDEIRELREQVSQLTQAVSLLLQDKHESLERERSESDSS